MTPFGLFSLAVLSALFVFQIVTYRFYRTNWNYKTHKTVFFISLAGVFLFYLYLVYARYQDWSADIGGIGKYFVPPHTSIFYVFGYEFTRFLIYYLVALAVAVLFLFSAKYLNYRFGGKFFENQEPYLGALSVFLLGHPDWGYAWIYYIAAVLASAVVGSMVMSHWLKKTERFSLYWLWLPIAILVALVRAVI